MAEAENERLRLERILTDMEKQQLWLALTVKNTILFSSYFI